MNSNNFSKVRLERMSLQCPPSFAPSVLGHPEAKFCCSFPFEFFNASFMELELDVCQGIACVVVSLSAVLNNFSALVQKTPKQYSMRSPWGGRMHTELFISMF